MNPQDQPSSMVTTDAEASAKSAASVKKSPLPVTVRTVRMGWFVTGLMTIGLVVLFARVLQLQTRPTPELEAQRKDRVATITEPARRGDLTDRRGRPLALSRFGYRAFIDPVNFPTKDTDQAIIRLCQALGLKPEEIGPKILLAMQENQRRLELAKQIAEVEAAKAAEAAKLAKAQPVTVGARGEELTSSEDLAGEEPVLPEAGKPLVGHSEAIAAGGTPAQSPAASAKPSLSLDRYLPLPGMVEESRLDVVRKLRIPGVHLETKQVREPTSDELVASILGKVGSEGKGMMGTEAKLDEALQPSSGKFSYLHDRRGRPLWVEPGSYAPPQRGEDLALSIDLELQRIVIEELERAVYEADAAGARAVMVDPSTGEIVAMADIIRELEDARDYDWQTVIDKDSLNPPGQRWRVIKQDPRRDTHPALARNRCVEDVYEPGSTFKSFIWAKVLDHGLIKPGEILNTHGGEYRVPYGNRTVKDVSARGSQTWMEVLINSSNIGMVKGAARMSFQQHHDAIRAFGFGEKTGSGLPGETRGIVTPLKDWTNWVQTSASYGYQVGVTPVQVARAFSVFSRRGEQNGVLPSLRLLAVEPGTPPPSDQAMPRRVVPRWVADLTRQTLRGVTVSLDRRMQTKPIPEGPFQYEIFGKSGTAQIPVGSPPPGYRLPPGSDGYFPQYFSSFVAAGPVEEPRLVLIVVIDDPGPDLIKIKQHRGGNVAGPVVRRVLERSLAYLGVPPSPPPAPEVVARQHN
jgi:cell division protein FtsI/penicillin-binding protein 2